MLRHRPRFCGAALHAAPRPGQRGEVELPRCHLDEPAPTAYLFAVPSPDPLPFTPLETAALLPDRFRRWFASRGWSPREHQLALLAKARDDASALLIAPTGAGKTLAGFLPTLVELSVFRCLEGRRREEPHLHRPQRETHRRPPHPLHLAAEGARGRHRAQSGDADCRDGPADQGRDPHRRHAGVAAAAAAALSAGHPAHHAGATGAAAVLRRRAVPVLLAQAHRARRAACARHLQARRSACRSAWRGCGGWRPRCARSGCRRRWPSRNRWRAFWCRSATAGKSPPTSSWPAARRRLSSRCSTPKSACRGPATPRAMRSAKCTS